MDSAERVVGEGAANSAGNGAGESPLQQLENYRKTIDNLDAALVHILAERFRCTQRVGQLKAEHAMPASDKEREARQIARLRILAEESDLDPVFAEKFLKFIVAEVIQHHEEIAAEKNA
ncbi:chorismate mutase [Trueperella bialowiezensis]|uniref:Chorismate mutase n=1 Tax=Trueperella bialowiezensis TaxID=312285 RepID=A0A3S4V9Q4_9ACTO|nr:chorismate mutase [Trueperella bialowiezensis]VEI12714.1 chorismate mutase [Trueperella bialowiezensis]